MSFDEINNYYYYYYTNLLSETKFLKITWLDADPWALPLSATVLPWLGCTPKPNKFFKERAWDSDPWEDSLGVIHASPYYTI